MKILFWSDGFWPRIGGTETQGLQFVQAMARRGHECLVLTQKYDSAWPDEELYENVLIERLNFNPLLQKGDLKMVRQVKERLEKIALQFRPEIIYLNTLENGSAFAFLLFHKIFRAPTVATIHTPYYEGSIPPLVKQICEQVDHLSTASHWAHGIMKGLLPSLKNPLRMIPYGLSFPSIDPTPLSFSPPTLLLLGRLSWEKGFDTAIDAFYRLKKEGSNATLLIGGSGPERARFNEQVIRLGLENDVEFIGELLRDREAIYQTINRATVVLMPSLFEAFGLVALEAMQMGRPVIASEVGGLPEIVAHQKRGLLVPLPSLPIKMEGTKEGKWSPIFREKEAEKRVLIKQEHAERLFGAMKTLLNDPKGTVAMGVEARKWALHHFRLEENLDQYEELFRTCV